MYQTKISSPVGELTLASDGTALTGLWIEGQKYYASTMDQASIVLPTLPVFEESKAWLDAYFSKRSLPPLPKLAPKGSEFRQNVWKLLAEIPYGETCTYGMLAQKLREKGVSAAAQAVGGAVGHNPILIMIPCHRVLGSNESLTGYAGGLDIKRQLLQLEGLSWI